jgi:hypothetical protein
MSPVRYELGFYIPEDGILHSHRRENLKSYMDLLLSTGQLRGTSAPLGPSEGANFNHWSTHVIFNIVM